VGHPDEDVGMLEKKRGEHSGLEAHHCLCLGVLEAFGQHPYERGVMPDPFGVMPDANREARSIIRTASRRVGSDALRKRGDAPPVPRDRLRKRSDASPASRDALREGGDAAPASRDALREGGDAPAVSRDALRKRGDAPPVPRDARRKRSDAPPIARDARRKRSDAPPIARDALRQRSDSALGFRLRHWTSDFGLRTSDFDFRLPTSDFRLRVGVGYPFGIAADDFVSSRPRRGAASFLCEDEDAIYVAMMPRAFDTCRATRRHVIGTYFHGRVFAQDGQNHLPLPYIAWSLRPWARRVRSMS
jgi:hypothetical protein